MRWVLNLLLLILSFSLNAQNTFNCDGKLYFFGEQDTLLRLVSIDDYETSAPTASVVCTLSSKISVKLNALGANPKDGYMYFIEKDPNLPEGMIRRLNKNCNAPVVCPAGNNPTIPFAKLGCFDDNGIYWIVDDNNKMTGWNINTCKIVRGPFNLTGYPISNDIVFNPWDCMFYTGDVKIDTLGNVINTGIAANGAGLALGNDYNIYSVGSGLADSILLTRYDLATGSKVAVGYVKPGSENGSDMASFVCASVEAYFTASPPACGAPVTISFTDSSTGRISTWSWDFGDGGTSGLKNPTHTFNTPGTYTVRLIVAANSCRPVPPDTFSLQVVIGSGVSATASGTPSGCGAGTGTASATPSGGAAPFTYVWSNSQTGATATGLSPGNYTVTITDMNGCTDTATVQIAATGAPALTTGFTPVSCSGGNNGTITTTVTGGTTPYTYTWSNGASGSSAGNLAAGTYTVTVTGNNNCTVTSSVTITEPPAINLTGSKTDANCGAADGSVSVTATGGTVPYTYLWSGGGNSSIKPNIPGGSYTVTVTDANGCTMTNVQTVNDIGSATVAAGGTNASCAGGTNGTASATATAGTQPYTYAWSNGASGPSVSNLAAGTYTVTVTSANGCKAIQTVIISEPPPVVPTATSTEENCGKGDGTATAGATGGTAPYTYTWSTGGTTGTISNLGAGTYTVTIADLNGCTATQSVTVNNIINTPTPVLFTLTPPVTDILMSNIRFSDLTSGATGWHWDFGDGATADGVPDPEHRYSHPGTYTACLTITASNGCVDTACKEIVVKPVWTFYIANTFTPDDDGVNDVFIGKGTNIIEHEMWIYDRWGDLVYTTGKTVSPDTAIPWDGKTNGGADIAQEDVYVYVVRFKDLFNGEHRRVGNVNLIR